MMTSIAMLQMRAKMGGWTKNIQSIVQAAVRADKSGHQILVCPELCLVGYPPEDLLFRQDLEAVVSQALLSLLARLKQDCPDLYVVVGYPGFNREQLYNAASVLHQGEIIQTYYKQRLPNYQVFDEKRYFVAGNSPCVFAVNGTLCGITICEDIWSEEPIDQSVAAGADVILNINASPFHYNKPDERFAWITQQAKRAQCAIVYVNAVGGQDELVFDGGSFAVNDQGVLLANAPLFESAFTSVEIPKVTATVKSQSNQDQQRNLELQRSQRPQWGQADAQCYQALVLGVRDYVNQNSFPGALIGLSGGIDSALTLAIAVDALGAEQVKAVMMPFLYTSQLSLELASEQARMLGIELLELPIHDAYHAIWSQLSSVILDDQPTDLARQNLQARLRGLLLMALSNQTGSIVLTTGNKSELSMGYATLYGDMAGGFNVLKDVYKTHVYQLAAYRNRLSAAIPQGVIDRAPSAELAKGQQDTDALPPYEQLDPMLRLYVDEAMSAEQIQNLGYDKQPVLDMIKRVDKNEYKRRQGALGVRISKHSFVRDRRYPITYQWCPVPH